MLVVFSSTRDEHGERVVLVTWHQGDAHDAPSRPGQMQLSTLDVERLRDFCDAWLSLVPPPRTERGSMTTTIGPRTIADPARARAHSRAERSIETIAINLDEIDQKDYAGAIDQLKHFIAAVTSDMAENKLDMGGVMLLGAACITVIREAVLEWRDKVADVAPARGAEFAPPEHEVEPERDEAAEADEGDGFDGFMFHGRTNGPLSG